jgi:hypothetical protein
MNLHDKQTVGVLHYAAICVVGKICIPPGSWMLVSVSFYVVDLAVIRSSTDRVNDFDVAVLRSCLEEPTKNIEMLL